MTLGTASHILGQRAVDALQTTASFRWKWILQLAWGAISALLAWFSVTGKDGIGIALYAVLTSFLAPVARTYSPFPRRQEASDV